MISTESRDISGFKFIWITDGQGWYSAKNNLEETFMVLDELLNIHDMESGMLEEILK
jgi:type II restriction enzyme